MFDRRSTARMVQQAEWHLSGGVIRQSCPALGRVFELTFSQGTPDGMILNFAPRNPQEWRFQGVALVGQQTRQFQLVTIGHQPNLKEAKRALEAAHGPTPYSQWLEIFWRTFKVDDKGLVCLADGVWLGPDSGTDGNFPCLSQKGQPYFAWPGLEREENCRWLVYAPTAK